MVEISNTEVIIGYGECLMGPSVSFDIYEIDNTAIPFFTIAMNFRPRQNNDFNEKCIPRHFSMTTGWSFVTEQEAYFFVYFMCSYCFKEVDNIVNVFDKELKNIKHYDIQKDVPNGFENMMNGSTTPNRSIH